MASGAQSTSVAAGRDGDVTFAQMMIPHHQQAADMAENALGKTDASSQVRDLATAITQAQDPEIRTMAGWLKQWGAAAPSDRMDHGRMGSGMMNEALEQASGTAFDQQWVSMMIAHHEGCHRHGTPSAGHHSGPDVKTLADAIINAQTEEISKMRALS